MPRRFRRHGPRGRGHRNQGNQESTNEWVVETQETEENLDIRTDIQGFFIGKASFQQHLDAQEQNKERYTAGLAVLQKNGVEISQNARVKALAAAWARKDYRLANSFLANQSSFSLVEVVKGLTLLDASRNIRVYEKKLKRLQTLNVRVKPKKLGKIKSNIDNLKAIRTTRGSASGALCKQIRKWVKTFTKEQLEFFALHYPAEPWRKLADICHFSPNKDFEALPWFLPYCYGEQAPDGTLVHQCKDLSADKVNDLLKEYPIPYSHLKTFKDDLNEDSKARIAANDPIDTILWYYEDLHCKAVDQILLQRLEAGEEITLNDGKLLDRLLAIKMIRENIPVKQSYLYGNKPKPSEADSEKAAFIENLLPIAQNRLENMSLPLEEPIVVIGDRSGSMEVAIRTSTIIASILSAIAQAKLVFFNNENMDAEAIPRNINDVLELAVTTTARGGTAPAASLHPFYEKKEVVKTFIIVTDEEENQSYKGKSFAKLFDDYYKEIFPAKLVFVSFLRSQHAQGRMVSKLKEMNYEPLQFRLDAQRPDLGKLDNLFGQLSTETLNFEQEVSRMEEKIRTQGMMQIFQDLTIKMV